MRHHIFLLFSCLVSLRSGVSRHITLPAKLAGALNIAHSLINVRVPRILGFLATNNATILLCLHVSPRKSECVLLVAVYTGNYKNVNPLFGGS